MNVEIMRKIDYWLGRPICFFLTVIDFLCKLLFFMKSRKENIHPKKFLFVELSEMGSAVLAYPAMKKTL